MSQREACWCKLEATDTGEMFCLLHAVHALHACANASLTVHMYISNVYTYSMGSVYSVYIYYIYTRTVCMHNIVPAYIRVCIHV